MLEMWPWAATLEADRRVARRAALCFGCMLVVGLCCIDMMVRFSVRVFEGTAVRHWGLYIDVSRYMASIIVHNTVNAFPPTTEDTRHKTCPPH